MSDTPSPPPRRRGQQERRQALLEAAREVFDQAGYGGASLDDVIERVGGSRRNKEIAARVVVTEKTVNHHVGQIHAKLGVRTRTEAVACGRDLGLVPLDSFALA